MTVLRSCTQITRSTQITEIAKKEEDRLSSSSVPCDLSSFFAAFAVLVISVIYSFV